MAKKKVSTPPMIIIGGFSEPSTVYLQDCLSYIRFKNGKRRSGKLTQECSPRPELQSLNFDLSSHPINTVAHDCARAIMGVLVLDSYISTVQVWVTF